MYLGGVLAHKAFMNFWFLGIKVFCKQGVVDKITCWPFYDAPTSATRII